jgi:hypothetical protein
VSILLIGEAEITRPLCPQFLTSVRVGFTVLAVLCLVGVVSQVAARKKG